MAAMDNFDALSNADIRAKCLENGLPNVPVTDSSRKLLIKKLRLSIGASPGTPNKTNRRETIGVTKIYPDIENIKKTSGVNVTKAAEGDAKRTTSTRRTLSLAPSVVAANQQAASPPEVSAPVSTRRRTLNTEQVAKPRTNVNNMIIIDESSDDDVNEELIAAVKHVEHAANIVPARPTQLPARSSTRGVSLSKTTVTTSSYSAAAPVQKESYVQPLRKNAEVPHTVSYNMQPQQQQPTASYDYQMQPQNSYITKQPPVRNTTFEGTSYSTPGADALHYYSPSLRRGTAAATTSLFNRHNSTDNYVEYSDDTDAVSEDVNPKSPFLSSFARNLERSRGEPVKRNSAIRSSGASIAERPYRRPQVYSDSDYQQEPESLVASLWDVLALLEQRFYLKSILLLVLVVLVIMYICSTFWQ